MSNAWEILTPLRSGLIAVPAIQSAVCRFCHGACPAEYPQCLPCWNAENRLGAVEILPVAMSIDGGLLHRHLRGYKDDTNSQVRLRMGLRLSALLTVFMQQHGNCVGAFDSVVPVSSLRRTAVEPVLRRVPQLRSALNPALRHTDSGSKRDLMPERFDVTRTVEGERVLLVDDTFTSGATLFSAAAALRGRGASIVGPLVLGRHVQPAWDPSATLLSWLKHRAWDQSRCCRCDGEQKYPGQLL